MLNYLLMKLAPDIGATARSSNGVPVSPKPCFHPENILSQVDLISRADGAERAEPARRRNGSSLQRS
jgi:hypothetical protein